MKRTLLTICAATVLFAACNSETKTESTNDDSTTKTKTADASTTNETAASAPMDSAAMQKAWMEYMTPGEMHKIIAASDGTWDCDVSYWMKAGAPPETSKATSVSKSIFNGLYQESVHKGSMMGMNFEGRGTMGFDNAKKKFVSSWYDNMGSGIMMMEGDYDPATKTITLTGDCTSPLNGKSMALKETFKMVDENTQVMEMYGPDMETGKEYKNMEIVMKRKK